jgi:acetyl esterase/lipase
VFGSRPAWLVVCGLFTAVTTEFPQFEPSPPRPVTAPDRYQVLSNLTYLTVNGHESRLDVLRRRDDPGPHPALIYIHGGGWVSGFKEDALTFTMPWIEMGWNVVSVEYRLAAVARAPGAVEDCLCALRWVVANADHYQIDPTRIVTMGDSAGGHLALMTGMTPANAGLDGPCNPAGDRPLPKVAAIVNWYGITDVPDILSGPNRKPYAVDWLSGVPDQEGMARKVSPLTWVRSGLPPIITIHGDSDPTVPYSQSVLMHEALDAAQVPNVLVTIPGGGHGGFSAEEQRRAYAAIRRFLAGYGLPTATPPKGLSMAR